MAGTRYAADIVAEAPTKRNAPRIALRRTGDRHFPAALNEKGAPAEAGTPFPAGKPRQSVSRV
jgi:hypothetical protein